MAKIKERRIFILNPRGYDFLAATIIEGLNGLGVNYSALWHSNYSCANYRDLSWLKLSDKDVILNFSTSGKILKFLRWLGHPNVFFIDGGDHMPIALGDCDGSLYRGVFKREYPEIIGDRSSECVWPLPFAAEKRYFSNRDFDKDIFLSCMLATRGKPFRSVVENMLRHSAGENWFVGNTNETSYQRNRSQFCPTPNYEELLSRSCISVNVMGAGYDCARFWEIPARKAALLSQRLPIRIPYPFESGVNAIFFETVADLSDRVNELKKGVLDWERIAQAGHLHLRRYHTTTERARYMLASIEKAISANMRGEWGKVRREPWGSILFG